MPRIVAEFAQNKLTTRMLVLTGEKGIENFPKSTG
jgi:hypothetical protein